MDDDIVPDLDDMTELVQGIKLHQKRQPQQVKATEPAQLKVTCTSGNQSENAIKNEDMEVKPNGFGGMKKGFLFGGGTKPKKKATSGSKKEKEGIISPKFNCDRHKDPLVLDEVQEAMEDVTNVDKSWLTEDLLKQVESNQKLSQQLANPRIAKAITLMQKDPKAAMEYYKNDKEIQEFFKEFYAILGKHFTKLGGQQSEQRIPGTGSSSITSEDEKAMQNILSNPEIKEILMKPHIQKLIQLLRNDPDEAQRWFNAGDASFRADVNKLVSTGVLGFQPH